MGPGLVDRRCRAVRVTVAERLRLAVMAARCSAPLEQQVLRLETEPVQDSAAARSALARARADVQALRSEIARLPAVGSSSSPSPSSSSLSSASPTTPTAGLTPASTSQAAASPARTGR